MILEEYTYTLKMKFNNRILKLRNEKQNIINEIKLSKIRINEIEKITNIKYSYHNLIPFNNEKLLKNFLKQIKNIDNVKKNISSKKIIHDKSSSTATNKY